MTHRPSRPIQASRLHGARWFYCDGGGWRLASSDMLYGWVESLPSFGSSTNRWHATPTPALVDLTDCVDGHVRRGRVFRAKRRAMRYLETIAISAWRRVLIAAAKKVAKMKAQEAEDVARFQILAEGKPLCSVTGDKIEVLSVTWIDHSGNGNHMIGTAEVGS